ncbi:MAG: hypothetical protein IJ356_09390 [Erysipelotrichaceae bacterium]|nr:hypothetical protein [Erysipelotrichaceae bacterium]
MTIVFQSVVMGALVLIAASAIVFPILFLVQFHGFRKDFKKAFIEVEDEVYHEL